MADALALYLADCIAATAHDFDKKSAPKGERMRHRRLCESAADLLSDKAPIPGGHRDLTSVVKRLNDMAQMLRRYE